MGRLERLLEVRIWGNWNTGLRVMFSGHRQDIRGPARKAQFGTTIEVGPYDAFQRARAMRRCVTHAEAQTTFVGTNSMLRVKPAGHPAVLKVFNAAGRNQSFT